MYHMVKLAVIGSLLVIVLLRSKPVNAAVHCFLYSDSVGYVCDTNPNPDFIPASIPLERQLLSETTHEAYVHLNNDVFVYPAPDSNSKPLYNMGTGFIFVDVTAVAEELVEETTMQRWYKIKQNHYIKEEAIQRTVRASGFQGVTLSEQPSRPFGWIVSGVRPSSTPGGPPNPDFSFLGRYQMFQVYDAAEGGDGWLWYNVGDGAWIKQIHVSLIDPKPKPGAIGTGHFWVEVDLYEQSFAAYQGDRMVYAGLLSSGLGRTPTREGLFQVWSRLTTGKMTGFEGWPEYYYLQNVPHIMYFDGSIGLHGAYWHDRFGYRASRGCVNMSPKDAEWVFNWSGQAPNTLWVWVHTSNPRHYFDKYH